MGAIKHPLVTARQRSDVSCCGHPGAGRDAASVLGVARSRDDEPIGAGAMPVGSAQIMEQQKNSL